MNTGTYDVYFSGRQVGNVLVTQCGLYTEIRCTCRCKHLGVLRLYRGSACLGVMTPEDGSIVLRKRFSANDIRRLRPDNSQPFELRGDAKSQSGWQPCDDCRSIFTDPVLADSCKK